MRISDWSSDVCSSDLERLREGREAVGTEIAGLRDDGAGDPPGDLVRLAERQALDADQAVGELRDGDAASADVLRDAPWIDQIGRASCRARECLDWEIAVGAAS